MPSYVDVVPQALSRAAHELEEIAEDLADAGKAAATYLARIVPAADDETSAAIALLFSEAYAREQAEQARWYALMNGWMTPNFRVASDAYASTEASAKAALHTAEDNVKGLLAGSGLAAALQELISRPTEFLTDARLVDAHFPFPHR